MSAKIKAETTFLLIEHVNTHKNLYLYKISDIFKAAEKNVGGLQID